MLRNAATKLAHNSTLPSLGNKELKPLQDLIVAEKTVLVSLRKLSADLTKAADALRSWAAGEEDELTDILNASTELVNYFCTALLQYSSYQDAMREHMKAVRDREEALDDLKRRRKALVAKAESAEKKMEKMSTDNKNFVAQNEILNRMREQLLAMASEIMTEEASLKDYKRLKARAWMEIKFGGMLECCEKGTIAGEFGKLVISEMSEEPTRPGMSRPVYTNHAKITSILTDALQCVERIAFSSFSPPPDSASVSRSHSRSSSVASSLASSPSLSSESTSYSTLRTPSDSGSPPHSAVIATPSSDVSRSPEPLKGEFSPTPVIAQPPEHKTVPVSDLPSRSPSLRTNSRGGGRFAAFPVKKRTTNEPSASTLRVSTAIELPDVHDAKKRSSAVFIGMADSSEEKKLLESNSSANDTNTSVTPVATRPLSMIDIERHLSIVSELHNPWSPTLAGDLPVLGTDQEADSFSSAVAAALNAHVSVSEGTDTAESASLETPLSNPSSPKSSSPKSSPPLVVETKSSGQRSSSQSEGEISLSTSGEYATLPTPLLVSPLVASIEPESIGAPMVVEGAIHPPVADAVVVDRPEQPLEEPATPRARLSPELSSESSATFGVRFSPIIVEIKRPVSVDEESTLWHEEDGITMEEPETPRAMSSPSTSPIDKSSVESKPTTVTEPSLEVVSPKGSLLDAQAAAPSDIQSDNLIIHQDSAESPTFVGTQQEGSEIHSGSPNRAGSPPAPATPGPIPQSSTLSTSTPRSSSSIESTSLDAPVLAIRFPVTESSDASVVPSAFNPITALASPRSSSVRTRKVSTLPLGSHFSDDARAAQSPSPPQSLSKPAFASGPITGLSTGIKKSLPSSPYPERRARSATGTVVSAIPRDEADVPLRPFSSRPVPSSFSRHLSRSLSATVVASTSSRNAQRGA